MIYLIPESEHINVGWLGPGNSEWYYCRSRRQNMVRHFLIRTAVIACIIAYPLSCTAGEDIWIEVQSPNLTVISNASVKQARRVARTLERFRIVLRTAMPDLRTDPGSPLIIIATRDKKSLNALFPEDRLKKDSAQLAGLFLASPDRNFVLLRADASSDQGYHVIYHEYVHMVMRLNFPSLPLWLNEGLAELFGYATIRDGFSGLGKVKPEYLEILKHSSIPLADLMAVTPDSPYYLQQDKSQIFYTQSWILAHYMLLGDPQASKQLNELLRLIQNDVSEKEAVKKVFGNLKTLENRLERYIRSDRFNYLPVETRLNVRENRYAARTLTRAESLAALGEVLVHTKRLDRAREMLEEALRLDPRSAHANEGMGFLYMRLEDPERAKEYFSAAAELDSNRYLAQYYAAHSLYQRGGDYEVAEKYLRKAMASNPNFAPVCDLLSCILALQEKNLPEALELAAKAATLEPSELRHRINIATILSKMGKNDEAYALGKRLLPIANTREEREKIDSLLQYVQNVRERALEAKRREEALQQEYKSMEEQRLKAEQLIEKYGAEDDRKQRADAAKPINTGPAATIKGRIESISCRNPARMNIVLNSDGNQLMLRAENYYKVQYWAVAAKGRSGFKPCEELQGRRVEIEYLSVSGMEYSGLIQMITIEK